MPADAIARKKPAPYIKGERREHVAREFAFRVHAGGRSRQQAASELGLSKRQSEKIAGMGAYRQERDEIARTIAESNAEALAQLQQRLRDAAFRGAERLYEIVDSSGDEAVVSKVAFAALDRTGFRPPSKAPPEVTHALSAESVRLLTEALAELPRIEALALEESPLAYAFIRKPNVT